MAFKVDPAKVTRVLLPGAEYNQHFAWWRVDPGTFEVDGDWYRFGYQGKYIVGLLSSLVATEVKR